MKVTLSNWRRLTAQLRLIEILNVAIIRVEHIQRIVGDAKSVVESIAESRVKQRAVLGVYAAIEFVVAK
tara:strand:- start:469 stop:675 length:207 start_codon:yes stop_codon:yes gene_type:complete